jgi:NitT/TauT family transport system substrate-binding protein
MYAGDGLLEPVRFSGWPELKEAFLGDNLQATFILAPMAMKLREEGHKIKIVYLGHRDGTALMVHKDSDIAQYRGKDEKSTLDGRLQLLRGKKIAIPNRLSNQYLILFKAFTERGLDLKEVTLGDQAPPDMPFLLQTKQFDGIIAGEPLMAKTEMEGFGEVLFLTKDVWPNFISCVLAVKESTIENRRDEVQRLVDGIARSGLWLDQDNDQDHSTKNTHRMQAAEFVGKRYYGQDPRLLRYVLSKPPDRVKYTNLNVRRKDFEEIEHWFKMSGRFEGKVSFDDYADPSFVPEGRALTPYEWELKK